MESPPPKDLIKSTEDSEKEDPHVQYGFSILDSVIWSVPTANNINV